MHPTQPGRQRTTRTERTKQRILDAAARLLADKGYEATTLDDVAEVARVSKGTIYYNFASKEDIFWAVVLPRVESSLEFINHVTREKLPPRDALRYLIQTGIQRVQDPAQRYIYFQEMLPLNDTMRKSLRDIERTYETGLANIIRAGQKTGEINEGDPRVMALIAIGTIARTARWYDPSGTISPEQFERTLSTVLLDGMFTKPARSDGAG